MQQDEPSSPSDSDFFFESSLNANSIEHNNLQFHDFLQYKSEMDRKCQYGSTSSCYKNENINWSDTLIEMNSIADISCSDNQYCTTILTTTPTYNKLSYSGYENIDSGDQKISHSIDLVQESNSHDIVEDF